MKGANKLFDAIYSKITETDENIRYPSKTGGCFIKGTLVHTKDGLKRIEEIKVGDYVLSSAEDGTGSPEYKQVVNTFVHRNKTICTVGYFTDNCDLEQWLTATGNHPFWVEGIGWTLADQLNERDELRLADGSIARVGRQYPVYRTSQKGVGWVQSWDDIENSPGTVFNYAELEALPHTGRHYVEAEIYDSDSPYLEVDVYNLEVEGNHTYYVEKEGVWVHNTNCTCLQTVVASSRTEG